MAEQAFRLFNTAPWKDPVYVVTFFKVTATSITDTYHKSEDRQWQALKYFRDNFKNVRTAVLTLLERVIDPVYHSAQMSQHGFGNDEPTSILKRIQRLYR